MFRPEPPDFQVYSLIGAKTRRKPGGNRKNEAQKNEGPTRMTPDRQEGPTRMIPDRKSGHTRMIPDRKYVIKVYGAGTFGLAT